VLFGYLDNIPLDGHYASTDPLLFDGGMNLYAYVNGEPVNAIDQSGLTGICVGGGVVTGLGGGFEYCEDISPDGTSGRPVLNKRNTHSICIEGAAGLSAGGGAVWKDPASTSATLGWDMGITCGPVTIGFSGEAGWKVNECGKWDITAGAGFKVQFGPYSVGFPLPEPGAGHATLGIETSNSPNMSAKCGLGVKASARGCKKW
jgi:hypothetical protein